MDKRAFTAFGLIFLFLIVWRTQVLPRMHPPPPPTKKEPAKPAKPTKGTREAPTETTSPAIAPAARKPAIPEPETTRTDAAPPAPPAQPTVDPADVDDNIPLESDLIRTVWSTRGAVIRQAFLKTYKDVDRKRDLALLKMPGTGAGSLALPDLSIGGASIPSDFSAVNFKHVVPSGRSRYGADLVFVTDVDGKAGKPVLRVEKRIRAPKGKFHLEMVLAFTNLGAEPIRPTYSLRAAAGVIPESKSRPGIIGIIANDRGKSSPAQLTQKPPMKLKEPVTVSRDDLHEILWAGTVNKYFAAVLCPAEPSVVSLATLEKIGPGGKTTGNAAATLRATTAEIPPGATVKHAYLFFIGPKAKDVLAKYPKQQLSRLLDFGTFGPICLVLIGLLEFFHRIIPNYGVAIVLMTIVVKVVLHPLTRKSQMSMHRMQKLQPKINELREKYKNNKQKLGQEQMAMFKEHGVNPMSGCLPMFLQIPVFIALFRTIRQSIQLRQAPFLLWIHDLSRPDALCKIGNFTLNLLPIAMTVTWVIQQKMMPKSTDPQQQQQQKMMMLMPIFFGFMLYSFPAGLALYWLTSTLLGILEQYWIRKQMAKMD